MTIEINIYHAETNNLIRMLKMCNHLIYHRIKCTFHPFCEVYLVKCLSIMHHANLSTQTIVLFALFVYLYVNTCSFANNWFVLYHTVLIQIIYLFNKKKTKYSKAWTQKLYSNEMATTEFVSDLNSKECAISHNLFCFDSNYNQI